MPTRIPLCHVQLLPLMSGIQRITLQILDVLDRDRYEPHVICQSPGPFTEELEQRNVRCHFVPNLVRPVHPWRDVAAYRDLKRLFERFRFSIVHTHCSKPGILGRIAAKKAGVPHVIHHVQSFAFHEFSSLPARLIYTWCEKLAAPYGDRVLFVNHEDLKTAIDGGILPSEKCDLIYNGIDLKPFAPAVVPGDAALRRRYGLHDDEAVIYFVARLEKPKQPLILPVIAAALDRRLPNVPWRMIIAGEGAYRDAVERRTAELGVTHRLQLVGWQSEEEKFAAYRQADVVLQPSLWEGLSLTLLEASAAGVPIVAGNVKGNREVVTPETGFLCSPKDAEDYARRLEQLLSSPDLRRKMGRAARIRAESLFDVERNMRCVTDLYDRLIGEAPQKQAIRPAAAA